MIDPDAVPVVCERLDELTGRLWTDAIRDKAHAPCAVCGAICALEPRRWPRMLRKHAPKPCQPWCKTCAGLWGWTADPRRRPARQRVGSN